MNAEQLGYERTDYDNETQLTFGQVLDQIRHAATSEAELGLQFEQLTARLLESCPEFGVKRVYTWSDWPDREKIAQFHGGPIGVDLVAETITGEFIAIQCKCYAPESSVPWDSLKSFFAFSQLVGTNNNSAAQQCVFDSGWVVSTTRLTRTGLDFIKKQSDKYRLIDFNEYRNVSFEEQRQVKKPFPFQTNAINQVLEGFNKSHHNRGRLIMACGTGKTLVSLRIAEQIKKGTGLFLYLAPSIALVNQARREWLSNTVTGFKPMVVCSDKSAGGRGEEDISVAELTCPVSTDVNHIANFLDVQTEAMRVVFCTYQSLGKVCEALKIRCNVEFDLTIADEAHRTTGILRNGSYQNFQQVHDEGSLRSLKRLYMTATPRVYTDASKKALETRGLKVVDMSTDPSTYGIEFYRINFGDAVDLGVLTEYRVIILGVRHSNLSPGVRSKMASIEYNPSTRSRSNIRPSDKEMVRVLGTALAVNGFYKEASGDHVEPRPLRKVIAYANSRGRSKWYAESLALTELKALISRRMDQGKIASRMVADHIDGESSAFDRTELLSSLERADVENETRIVSNCKLFTEGVDVPSLDAVVFLDPRDSEVDVIQAVGRVMRRAEGKKFGYIVVPVVLPDNSNWLDELEQGKEGYATIGKVLRALQAHDSKFWDN